MAIELDVPGIDGLREAAAELRQWQGDAAPMQLHPGDLGWYCRFGSQTAAAAVRTCRRDLADPVKDPGVRIETIGRQQAPVWAQVLRSSFDGPRRQRCASGVRRARWCAPPAPMPVP